MITRLTWVVLFLIALTHLTGSAVLGQGPVFDPPYTTDDGLGDSSVVAVLIDRSDTLWFGHGSGRVGVTRFDGGSWQVISRGAELVGNNVRAIYQDRAGNVWFGTAEGVSRLSPAGEWASFPIASGMIPGPVQAILQDRAGNLWFGTQAGLSRLGIDGAWRVVRSEATAGRLVGDHVLSLLEDSRGDLWVGTMAGVSRLSSQGSWTPYRHLAGLDAPRVPAIAEGPDGTIWFAVTTFSQEAGYVSHGVTGLARDGTWRRRTTADGLIHDRVLTMLRDSHDNLWFGTLEGLSRLAPDGTWRSYTTRDKLAHNRVEALAEDPEGNLWVGTRSGVSRHRPPSWQVLTARDGLASSDVRAILQDRRGALWFGTHESGLSRLSVSGSWTTFRAPDPLPDDRVNVIFEDRAGALWVGTRGGVVRFDGSRWDAPILTDHDVRAIWQDSAGDFWFGTVGRGVRRYDPQGREKTIEYQADTPASAPADRPGLAGNVWAIFQDRDGSMWFGTSQGLSRLSPDGSWETHRRDAQDPQHSLADNSVRAIWQDQDGNLWVGTDGGLSRLSSEGPWQTFTTDDGLASNRVLAIAGDGDRRLWLGTSGGLNRFNGQSFATFSRDDGLPGTEAWAVWIDDGGDVWLGTPGGVARYQSSGRRPQVRLMGVEVNDQPYTDANGQPYPRFMFPEQIEMAWDDQVRLIFAGGDLRDLDQVAYRCQRKELAPGQTACPAEPDSAGWFDCPGGSKTYPRLADGRTHCFWAVALDKELNTSEPTPPLAISVARQPWLAKRWVQVSLVVATFVVGPGLAYGYVVYRRWGEYGYSEDWSVVLRQEAPGATDHLVEASIRHRRELRQLVQGRLSWWIWPTEEPRPALGVLDRERIPELVANVRADDVDEDRLQELGELLFSAAFPPELAERLVAAQGEGRAVRLRLQFDSAPELAAWPWEFLHGGDRLDFLGISPDTAMTRYLTLASPVGRLRTRPPLKVLVVIADPIDLEDHLGLPRLNVAGERRRLKEALREIREEGKVEVEFLTGASTGAIALPLVEALGLKLQEGFDVVHFACHGDVRARDARGFLYLENQEGYYVRVFQDELAALFRGYHAHTAKSPKLVVLNACQSAATSGAEALAGLAPALIAEGRVPAVVGMQFPITDDAALRFSSLFYKALAEHGQIDYAISVGRQAIAADGLDVRDWGVPVLYMQAPDGVIFELG